VTSLPPSRSLDIPLSLTQDSHGRGRSLHTAKGQQSHTLTTHTHTGGEERGKAMKNQSIIQQDKEHPRWTQIKD